MAGCFTLSEREQELIAMLLEDRCGFSRARAKAVSAIFESRLDFASATRDSLSAVKLHSGRQAIRADEISAILKFNSNGGMDPSMPLPEAMISAITGRFINRQIDMLKSMKLSSLNPNPFIIRSLNLATPSDVVRLNVYAAATRSIVTSFGSAVENMLVATSDSVEKVRAGWDLVKVKDGIRHWIQVKSGPNDMDKDQVNTWRVEIERKEKENEKGYIGVTYGKRENATVTFGLLKSYLPNYELRTLIGRELWEFLGDDPQFPSKVLDVLRREAIRALSSKNIIVELDDTIARLTSDFTSTYGDGEAGVGKYIESIF